MVTDISEILYRVQKEIPIEEITPNVVAQFLAGHDDRGKTLGRRIIGSVVAKTIQKEFGISITISLVNEFAESKHITLTERTRGGIYENWGRYHKKAIVIFKDGKIKTWKYLK